MFVNLKRDGEGYVVTSEDNYHLLPGRQGGRYGWWLCTEPWAGEDGKILGDVERLDSGEVAKAWWPTVDQAREGLISYVDEPSWQLRFVNRMHDTSAEIRVRNGGIEADAWRKLCRKLCSTTGRPRAQRCCCDPFVALAYEPAERGLMMFTMPNGDRRIVGFHSPTAVAQRAVDPFGYTATTHEGKAFIAYYGGALPGHGRWQGNRLTGLHEMGLLAAAVERLSAILTHGDVMANTVVHRILGEEFVELVPSEHGGLMHFWFSEYLVSILTLKSEPSGDDVRGHLIDALMAVRIGDEATCRTYVREAIKAAKKRTTIAPNG